MGCDVRAQDAVADRNRTRSADRQFGYPQRLREDAFGESETALAGPRSDPGKLKIKDKVGC